MPSYFRFSNQIFVFVTEAHVNCSSLTCRPTNYLAGKEVLSRKQPTWQGWRFIYYLSATYKVGKGAEIAQSVQSSSDALDNRGLVAVKYFSLLQSVQKGSGAHPASCSKGTGDSAQRNSGRDAKLTTHLHLVPQVKNEWVMPLSRCAFMECIETSLPLPYQ